MNPQEIAASVVATIQDKTGVHVINGCPSHGVEDYDNNCLTCRWQYVDTTPEHTHQYVIPVEWQDFDEPDFDYPIGMNGERKFNTVRKVTKLRCQCGEEIER